MTHHTMTVADPRDPDGFARLDVEYDAHRDRDDPSVGYRGFTEFRIDEALLGQLSVSERADVEEQLCRRHADYV